MTAERLRGGAVASSLLLTDLYELNMMQAYLDAGMTDVAVFEFFVRKLPGSRNFLMAAGLEQVVQFLEAAQFHADELDWLVASGRFTPDLIDRLAEFRFTGDVHGMPEGTIFFPNEPILRLAAPMPEAQLLESRIINLLHFQTLIASKAARSVLVASDKLLIDFGLRRAHGAEAGLLAARASYLAGFAGTSTTLAEVEFDIPIYGTMAHSFVQAHESETASFEHFARSRPQRLVLLIDTYDTETGARKVVDLAPKLAGDGIEVSGVRLDSGDLGAHAVAVREILDAGGLRNVRIFASGGLDEFELARLAAAGAPIDGFGVGTALTTSADAPALDCAYKLQEYNGQPKRKLSEGKATWPGRKQVLRHFEDGKMSGDVLALEGEELAGEPLIIQVMQDGARCGADLSLESGRRRAVRNLAQLPASAAALDKAAATYPVTVSAGVRGLADQADRLRESVENPLPGVT